MKKTDVTDKAKKPGSPARESKPKEKRREAPCKKPQAQEAARLADDDEACDDGVQ
jgi:hypothetical protein